MFRTGFSKLKSFCLKYQTPVSYTPDDGVSYWRDRLLSIMLLIAVGLGIVAIIPSVNLAIETGRWIVAIVDSFIYLIGLILVFRRSIPFRIRSSITVAVFYLLGLVLSVSVGPYGASLLWLFIFPVFTALFLGFIPAIAALGINGMTLLGLGVVIFYRPMLWQYTLTTRQPLEEWIAISGNFLLTDSIVTLATAFILKGLQTAFVQEKRIQADLTNSYDRLREANERLVMEMAEKEQAQIELRISEEKYRTLVTQMNEGVLILNPEFEITFVNPNVLRLTGYSEAELIGKGALTFLSREDEETIEKILAAKDQGVPTTWEISVIKKDGSQIVFLASGTTLMKDDQTDGFIVILTDISALKKVEKELKEHREHLEEKVKNRTWELEKEIEDRKRIQQERQKLEEHLRQARKMESLGTLAGGIAHDFNTMLGTIIGYTDMILQDLPQDAEPREDVTAIARVAEKAKTLVSQIRDFSRPRSIEKRSLDLVATLRSSVDFIRGMLPSSIIVLETYPQEEIVVEANESQINQVMVNLCTNARDFIPGENGRIDIKLARVEITGDSVEGNMIESGVYAELSVSDNGTGIEPEIVDRIFDPYFTTKAFGKGSGLGLSVVHGIVESHHGTIFVKSEPDKGTRFLIYFPAVA